MPVCPRFRVGLAEGSGHESRMLRIRDVEFELVVLLLRALVPHGIVQLELVFSIMIVYLNTWSSRHAVSL